MSWFKLKRPMDEYTNVDPGDIVNAKQASRDLGYYQPPIGNTIGAWVDNKLFDCIRNFQRDNRLKVDGVMKPGGPTEAAINAKIQKMPFGTVREVNLGELERLTMCACTSSDHNPYQDRPED
jgi:hypothetical protein